MRLPKLSSFVRSEVSVLNTTVSIAPFAHAKRTRKATKPVLRGLGKPLTDFRSDRLPHRFRTRPHNTTRLNSFGRKPAKQTPRVTQVNEEQHPLDDEGGKKEKLGSNIPWGKGKIIEVTYLSFGSYLMNFKVMTLWFSAFVMFRSSIWKLGMWVLGIASEAELSASGQAAFTLGLDFSMLAATVFILQRSLQEYQPLRKRGLFPLTTKGNWWIIVLFSCLCIPLVDWLGTRMTVWFPEEVDFSTSNVVVQLSKGDLLPNVLYFILLSFCAPIWEELMFRGFLLPSLGKFLPSALAILTSAMIFALMHGNLRQFVPLCVLGVVIGNAFVRSNNLLSAMVLHSIYNCYVFFHVLFGF